MYLINQIIDKKTGNIYVLQITIFEYPYFKK